MAITEMSTVNVAIFYHGTVRIPEMKCLILAFCLKSSKFFRRQYVMATT